MGDLQSLWVICPPLLTLPARLPLLLTPEERSEAEWLGLLARTGEMDA